VVGAYVAGFCDGPCSLTTHSPSPGWWNVCHRMPSKALMTSLVRPLAARAVLPAHGLPSGQGAFARVAARAVQARLARPYLPVGMYRRGLAWSTGPRKFQLLSQQHVKAFTTVILETPEQQPSKGRGVLRTLCVVLCF
jgi:hypothetical protein